MASGQILVKFRSIYRKAEDEVKKWNIKQATLVSLLGTAANVLARLPALQDDGNYGPLKAIKGYQEQLVVKQVQGFEALLKDLYSTLEELDSISNSLQKLSRDAEQFIKQDKRLTPAARALQAPPVPSIDQCLQGLQDIAEMHSKELKLQQALVMQLTYDRSEAEVLDLQRAAAAQVHINKKNVDKILYVVEATEEARSLR